MGVGSQSSGGCSDERLLVLLEQDESSAEFRAAARHVEQCRGCQKRLEELAKEGVWGGQLRSLLAQCGEGLSSGGHRSQDTGQEELRSEPQLPDLDFLAPGSHPEMLGRLGRYEIEKVLGSGGMGMVLKAYDTELNRPVAIKVLASHLLRNGTARQRFAREGRAAAAIVHENVVAIHNVESEGQTPYLVMHYVDGQSLQSRVEQRGPLNYKELLRIGMQTASGLAAAHAQGLVHRDIKPSNILLEGDLERVYLTDFGLARAADDVTLTGTGMVAGTPSYMSPEQARGEATDARSDLFSLGASLYFAATGQPPFQAESWFGVVHRVCNHRQSPACRKNPEIPVELSRTIDRLLEKRPHRRFKTAEAVRAHLAGLLARSQAPVRLLPQQTGPARWSRIRRCTIAGVVAGLVLVTASSRYWCHRAQGPGRTQQSGATVERLLSASPASERTKPLRSADRHPLGSSSPALVNAQEFEATWQREISSLREAIGRLESQWGQEN